MEQQERNFIALLSQAVRPTHVAQLQDPDYGQILKLAESHAVSGLLYPSIKQHLPMGDPILAGLKRNSFSAATRESIQAKELGQIFAACKERKIPILPLKGCVIKALYPYPELRFMSDADLLIREEDRQVMRQLMENLGHRFHKVDAGDTDIYISPLHMNYEIHLTLKEEGFSDSTRTFTEALLEKGLPTEDNPYLLDLPGEEHYIYILCHFIKHFIYGGVGVRQLTDLFISYHGWELKGDKLDKLLKELGLTQFQQRMESLWGYWFGNLEADEITEELSTYILHSGVFGNEEQRSTDRILSQGQDRSYVFARLFPPYKTMKSYFPILKKLPFLLPFAWIWRAIRAVLFRRKKLSIELKAMSNTKEDALEHRKRFYSACGLAVYGNQSKT